MIQMATLASFALGAVLASLLLATCRDATRWSIVTPRRFVTPRLGSVALVWWRG